MHLLFVSDVHLSFGFEPNYQRFLHFLQTEAPKADSLYILGDLFDRYLGDEILADDFWQPLIQAFQTLATTHTRVFIMRGNHDFMLTEQTAKRLGATLLMGDFHTLKAFGQQAVITHGDALCTGQTLFQFSRLFYAPLAWISHYSPFSWREKVAKLVARQGVERYQDRHEGLNVKQKERLLAKGQSVLKKAQADYLIYGHLHWGRQIDSQYILGSWLDSKVCIGRWDEKGMRLTHVQMNEKA